MYLQHLGKCRRCIFICNERVKDARAGRNHETRPMAKNEDVCVVWSVASRRNRARLTPPTRERTGTKTQTAREEKRRKKKTMKRWVVENNVLITGTLPAFKLESPAALRRRTCRRRDDRVPHSLSSHRSRRCAQSFPQTRRRPQRGVLLAVREIMAGRGNTRAQLGCCAGCCWPPEDANTGCAMVVLRRGLCSSSEVWA